MTMPGNGPNAAKPEGAWVKPNDDQNWTQSTLEKHLSGRDRKTWDKAHTNFGRDIREPLSVQEARLNDFSNTMEGFEQKLELLLLQGNAIRYTSPGTYDPALSPGVVSIEVVVIGGGGSGSNGQGDGLATRRRSGCGGAGGGCTVATITREFMGDGIVSIIVGGPGAPQNGAGTAGANGGDSSFGAIIQVGGGSGAITPAGTDRPVAAIGGYGMIVGGDGGLASWMDYSGENPNWIAATAGQRSSSNGYALQGGGGGGGGGGSMTYPNGVRGGDGVASRGGIPKVNNGNSIPPHRSLSVGCGGGAGGWHVATGGGTMAGSAGDRTNPDNTGFGGGGGGGFGGDFNLIEAGGIVWTRGGWGAPGVVYVIERYS